MTATGHEDEFRRLFEDEANTRLTALAEQALELETRGGDRDLVSSMFRNAHTLKGGAGVVGFDQIADAVHALEQLLEDLREGRRSAAPPLPDVILAAVDALRDMIALAMAGEDQSAAQAAVRAALARADAAEEPAPMSPLTGRAVAPAGPPRPREETPMDDRESIPVPVRRLDELVRLVGEGAAAQLRVGRLLSDRLGDEPGVIDEYRELARVLQELQEKAMRARMVSVGGVASPLRRAVRDIARASGKEVRWDIAGEDTELDRHVLERLRDPLVALVRNAIDHGIEPPDERVAAGKDPAGTVRLHAMQIGSDVIITVADDGRGIDLDEVRYAVGGRRSLTDAEALSAIFDPGVSTARELTDISGRGVGLDAVRAAVDELRGRVEVHSRLGEGTEFRISVPMTLAILRCLLLVAGGRHYAVPMHAAVALLAPDAADAGLTVEGRPAVWVGGDAVAVSDLGTLLGVGGEPAAGPVLVLATPSGRHAFRADDIAGQRDVVVKDVGRLLPRLDLLAGASVEPDGTIMLVLDPGGLIEAASGEAGRAVAAIARARRTGAGAAALPAPGERGRILVVDDALTIRELQRSILERAGYEVLVASDGREALARLAETAVDLVLTDIEMPKMDGFELTAAIRATSPLSTLPVLILTSRADEEDRARGLEAGADAYLVKSAFDEHALLTAVERLLGRDTSGGDTP